MSVRSGVSPIVLRRQGGASDPGSCRLYTRRQLVQGAGTVAAMLVAASCAPAAQPSVGATATPIGAAATPALRPLTMKVGLHHIGVPWHILIKQYDEKNSILKETGKEYGYDLSVEWLLVGFAPDVFSGMASGTIPIGMAATFPLISQWVQGVELLPLHMSVGNWRFVLVVDPKLRIRKFEDLKGKTIGAVLGTQLQSTVDAFLQAEFGQSAQQLGIKYVQHPEAVDRIPTGIDAVSTSLSRVVDALKQGRLASLIHFSGVKGGATTGSAYEGPLGKGEGIEVPSAKKSPFFPDGFVALRHYTLTTPDFLSAHPKAVEAFVVAHQRMIQKLSAMSAKELGDLYPPDFWKDQPREEYVKELFLTDLMYQRGWVWPTEHEVRLLELEARQLTEMGKLKQPLDRAAVLAKWKKTAPVLKAAYEKTKVPAKLADFTPGKPIWELVQ